MVVALTCVIMRRRWELGHNPANHNEDHEFELSRTWEPSSNSSTSQISEGKGPRHFVSHRNKIGCT